MPIDQSKPCAVTAMLIRRPVATVFDAFVNPAVTTRFWFTESSGPLVAGQSARWTWGMYNHTETVFVRSLDANRSLTVEWGQGAELTLIEWTFEARGDQATFVTVRNGNFAGDPDQIVAQVRDATEGFALMLAGAKAWLEHGVELGLVGDRFPEGI